MNDRTCSYCGEPEDDDGTGWYRLVPDGVDGWVHYRCEALAAEDAEEMRRPRFASWYVDRRSEYLHSDEFGCYSVRPIP